MYKCRRGTKRKERECVKGTQASYTINVPLNNFNIQRSNTRNVLGNNLYDIPHREKAENWMFWKRSIIMTMKQKHARGICHIFISLNKLFTL